jgi:predicted MFS family arabinose efflux permease
VREGLKYVRVRPRILGVLLITVFMNVWAFPFITLLPVFARDVLGRGPIGLGLLGAAHGVGAFLGLFVVHWGRRRWSNEALFTGGSILSCLGLVGFASSPYFLLSAAFLFVSGVGQAGFSIMQSAIILVEAVDAMRSRVMGTLVLAIGGGPLGRLQGGAMAEAWGAPLAVGTMAGCAGLMTLLAGILLRGFIVSARSRPTAVVCETDRARGRPRTGAGRES